MAGDDARPPHIGEGALRDVPRTMMGRRYGLLMALA